MVPYYPRAPLRSQVTDYQRLADRVGAATPCEALSTWGSVMFVLGWSELHVYVEAFLRQGYNRVILPRGGTWMALWLEHSCLTPTI